MTVEMKNKALRQKAGMVFVNQMRSQQGAKKAQNDDKIYLDDEQSVINMFQEIKMQDQGTLKQRLTKISYGDTGIISQK